MSRQSKIQINQIKNLIGIKKVIILEGNVDDIYEWEGKYINVQELLNEIFSEKGYHKRLKFDKYSGFLNLETNTHSSLQSNTATNFDLFSGLSSLLPQKNEKVGVVVDYTNYIFKSEISSEEDKVAMTAFSKILKENVFDITEIGSLQNCVIFIAKEINQLPPDMYLSNNEVSVLKISKPDRSDREIFINTLRGMLGNVIDIFDEMETIIDYTEGWTLKEISHFVRYVFNLENPLKLKKVIADYLYGEKISPWEELNQEKIRNLKSYLSQKVLGQDYVIEKVYNVISKAALGLSELIYSLNQTKPKGVLFLVGPTGVGKTELAKAVTKYLFGDVSNLIRFDMSEYSAENSDQKLIGAPPGYVGFEGGGQLTNAVKEKPFSVILFDEIEKANPKILDKFLQILEDGRLTDNTGNTVSFSETLIIFTSNIGASTIDYAQDDEMIRKDFLSAVNNYFLYDLNRPEILGRIGNNVIPFSFIRSNSIKIKILKSKLKILNIKLKEKYNIDFNFDFNDNKLIDLVLIDVDPRKGGRDIINSIETNLVDKITNFLLINSEKYYGKVVKIFYNDGVDFK